MLNDDLTGGPRSSLLQITPAERAVLQLMADGQTAYEIAERLAIASAHVDAYLSALVVRMGVATRADAVAAASRRGLVALDDDDPSRADRKMSTVPAADVVGNEDRGIRGTGGLMSEFVYLYRSGPRPSRSPKQAQQEMQRWMTWLKELTDKGHVKNPGHPLERTGKLVTGKTRTVTDGPFAEAKDVVGGYTLVEAADLRQATELAAGCPIFEIADGTVEVRPVMRIG